MKAPPSDLFAVGPPVGLLKGFSPVPHQLEVDVIVLHREQSLPGFGELLLVEIGPQQALVGRVSRYHATGQLVTERGDAYLGDLAKSHEDLPPTVVQQMLRYHLKMELLGHVQAEPREGLKFSVGVRSFATLGSKVRTPSDAVLAFLCNVGLENDPTAVPLGHLAYGQRTLADVPVRFSVGRLKGRRSFVFARAGYGKSNLIKYLIAQLYSSPPDVGLLLFDPEGEYALPDAHGRCGLVNVPSLRQRVSLYTNRSVAGDFADVRRGNAFVDFGDFPPPDIVSAFVPADKQDTVFANLLRSMEWSAWRQLIQLLAQDGFAADDKKMGALLGYRPKLGDVSMAAVRNSLVPAIRRLHRTGSPLARNVIEELRQSRVVIVDTSLLGSEDAYAVTSLILHRVFHHNVRHLTDVSGPTVRCLAVLEEAQTFLAERALDDRSVFVRWVKEGRKYGLGAILVTQQPGAISGQIISQGDNFFVLHLLNASDLQTLQRHNAYFSDDILNFLRTEPIPGNCYFWSAPNQPFVLPVRVANFESVCQRPAKSASATTAPKPPARQRSDRTARAVKETLERHPRLWIYRVESFAGKKETGWIVFSRDYLLNLVAQTFSEDAEFHQRPGNAEWLRDSLAGEIETVLRRHKVRAGFAVLEGVTRPVWSIPQADLELDSAKSLRPVAVDIREQL